MTAKFDKQAAYPAQLTYQPVPQCMQYDTYGDELSPEECPNPGVFLWQEGTYDLHEYGYLCHHHAHEAFEKWLGRVTAPGLRASNVPAISEFVDAVQAELAKGEEE